MSPGDSRLVTDVEVQESWTSVQQISTATSPPSTDLVRPKQARELPQQPVLTSMPLVHTEEVRGMRFQQCPSVPRQRRMGRLGRSAVQADIIARLLLTSNV